MILATFAGGCFWCIQGPFDAEPGVISTHVGYAGDSADNADYYKVASGATQHREAMQLEYDPARVTYQRLLDIYWRQIDPTDVGGQFADRGHQYTTAIYYHTPEQKQLAEQSKQVLQESGKFEQPITTEILPYSTFFPAEDEHQEYYKKNPLRYKMYKRGSGRTHYLDETWSTDKLGSN